MPDVDLVERFERYLRTSTRKGAITQKRYPYEVRMVLGQLGNPLAELTPGDLLAWHSALQESGAAPGTMGLKHAALRSFLRYLQQFEQDQHAGLLLATLMQVELPRASTAKREAYALTAEEVEQILSTASDNERIGLRDRALINFLWATGTRRAEVAGLTIPNLSLRQRTAIVLGKGDKLRPVIFDQACRQDLATWLKERPSWAPSCNNVFISANGAPISLNTIGVMVRETGRRAGIKRDVWTHVFRHSRITDLLNRGMNIQDTATFVGHRSVDTTMRYFHMEVGRLKKTYDQATGGEQSIAGEGEMP